MVSLYSTIKMMHGPIYIRFKIMLLVYLTRGCTEQQLDDQHCTLYRHTFCTRPAGIQTNNLSRVAGQRISDWK